MKAAISTRPLVLLLAMAALTVGLDVPAARAVMAPQLPHSSWTKTGGGEATEVRAIHRIVKEPVATWWQKDPNVYWASQFFPARNASGGYFGLQKRSFAPAKVAISDRLLVARRNPERRRNAAGVDRVDPGGC